MNRRHFIACVVAAPFARVGAVERFLVGRYGTPVEVEWKPINLTLGLMAFWVAFTAKDDSAGRVAHRMAVKMLAPAVAEMGERL